MRADGLNAAFVSERDKKTTEETRGQESKVQKRFALEKRLEFSLLVEIMMCES